MESLWSTSVRKLVAYWEGRFESRRILYLALDLWSRFVEHHGGDILSDYDWMVRICYHIAFNYLFNNDEPAPEPTPQVAKMHRKEFQLLSALNFCIHRETMYDALQPRLQASSSLFPESGWLVYLDTDAWSCSVEELADRCMTRFVLR